MPRKGFLRIVLRAVFILTVTFILVEAGVRIWGYSARNISDPIYMRFAQTAEISYVYKPNLVKARARGLVVLNTDSLGLRSETSGVRYGPKEKNEYRIAIVGDSVTFGEGIPNTTDTFVKVMERVLNEKQTAVKVRTFNYGASAYSVRSMAASLRYRMFDIDPDLVVMAIIVFDLDLDRTPTVDEAGNLVDSTLAHFAVLPPIVRGLLRKLHVSYVLRDLTNSFRSNNKRPIQRGELPESYFYVRQFKQAADAHGVSSFILLLPSTDGSPFGPISTELQRDGIPFVDVSPLREEYTREQFMASRFDLHPSRVVHRRIGQIVADQLLRGACLQSYRKQFAPCPYSQ